ncbi:MAG: HEAT repeat domain-containing protein, partial [Nitrospira sp.]
MRCILSLITLGALVLLGDQSWARRDALTAEQKSQLERIDRVLVDVIVLSDKGSLDAKPLVDVVVTRMKEFDYTTVTDPTQPHDVELKIKCEQRKTWEGTTTMGSDADLPDAPSRIWKGPACQLGYLLNGKKMAWRKEVRTDFDDAQAAATLAKAGDPTAYA